MIDQKRLILDRSVWDQRMSWDLISRNLER